MKIIPFFIYILILFVLIFSYTGCPAPVEDPDPTPVPTRIPEIIGLEEVTTIVTGDAWVIASQGDYLYYTGCVGNTGNLGIIDFSAPLNPVIMGNTTIGRGQGIAVSGNTIFVQMDPENGWNSCIASFSVSDPNILVKLDEVPLGSTQSGSQSYYKDGFLYNCSMTALSIYNVANPSEMVFIMEIPTSHCMWAAFRGDYLYISQEAKITIYNISIPGNPNFYGELTFNPGCDNGGIAVSGIYAYVGDNFNSSTIAIIDVSYPGSPQLVKTITVSPAGLVHELKVLSHYLLGVTDNGFFVLDISDALNPVEVDYLTSIGFGWGFTINGRYAIVSDDTLYRVIELLSE